MMKQTLRDVADASADYLDSLATRSVAPSSEAVERLSSISEPLSRRGTSLESIQDTLENTLAPATMATTGPRFFGFVTGGCHPAGLVANWYAGAWDQNVFSHTGSPAGAAVEQVALDWLIDLFGLDADCGGAFVTGATMANFTSLAAARNELFRRVGWDIEAEGFIGAPPLSVVVSAEAHPTLLKALRLLGFGSKQLIRVPTDDQGRMRADQWPDSLVDPVLVCLQAGNVNTGAFDPADELIPLARQSNSWIHVDGAFGLWAAVTPSLAHLATGFLAADSWAIDGHKWLNVPYDCGIALVSDKAALNRAVGASAPYLPKTDGREPFHFNPELSRRMRGVEIWAVLKYLGREGLEELIESNCRLARKFADGLSAAGFEILNEVVLNQVLVSFGSEKKCLDVIAAIQQDGTCWCGPTVWHGRTAMRISVSCWATEEEDINKSVDAIAAAASLGR